MLWNKILTLFGLFTFSLCKYPVTIETNDSVPIKILLFADFGYPTTLINTSNFSCDVHPSCRYEDEKINKGDYYGKPYDFRYAFLKIKVPNLEADSKNKYVEMEIQIRLNTQFNTLGMNDISSFINDIPWEHELVFDLNNNSIGLQKFDSKSKFN